jgi:hypothetical protein
MLGKWFLALIRAGNHFFCPKHKSLLSFIRAMYCQSNSSVRKEIVILTGFYSCS